MWRGFIGHLPETMVFFSLFSLLGISYYQLRSIHSSLQEINDVLEPATRAASDLQFALSREAAATRAFLLTGNSEYQSEFQRSRSDRRDALRRMSSPSVRAVPGIQSVLSEAEAQLAVADRRLDALHGGTLSRAAYLVDFPDQHRRFGTLIASAATLHQRLRARATDERRRIEATERFGMMLEVVGIVLAVIAGFAVVGLKARERAARIASERAQADADRRRAQLEASTLRWMRLIRGFTHDLKNPLNAIDGHLFTLETGASSPLAPPQARAVARCRHGVQTALALTVDLVDLARAETADVDVRRVEMDLCDLVASLADDHRAQASAKGLALVTDLPSDFEPIHSDPARVRQILGNLISNAVKYTDAGTIAISVQRRPGAGGADCIAVDVSDTGRGIPPEDQHRIFTEFEQVERGAPTGTGIGLAISDRLAQTLGGSITVHSEGDKGSTFTLWLPRTAAP